HMAANYFKTISDISAIPVDKILESVTLEYKSSNILAIRDVSALCKTVTAFANSAGGQFIIGIESDAGRPVRLDGGVVGLNSLDWIHKIINANTYPPVESVEVNELHETTGNYYVISVPASISAPHQSNDKRYYKRRGTHSEPMEHYEIEDIRNRPKQAVSPLRAELFMRDQAAFLYLKNDHVTDSIKNIRCRIDANVEFQKTGIASLGERGIREFRAQTGRYFLIDSLPMMLSKNAEPELTMHITYEFHDATKTDKISFFLADLMYSIVMHSPIVNAINALTDKMEKLTGYVEKIGHDTKALSKIVDGTGLRVSQRTLRALKNVDQLFDPYEFDWGGYKILLDISAEESVSLYQIFGTMGRPADKRTRYEALPLELRDRFEKAFKVSFD
ncbi:MAG: ATP-binding protein, partial [Fimbriimonadaceae bacterium]|nr:ATP-binding protein [Alphaproteobacteria bacterium]